VSALPYKDYRSREVQEAAAGWGLGLEAMEEVAGMERGAKEEREKEAEERKVGCRMIDFKSQLERRTRSTRSTTSDCAAATCCTRGWDSSSSSAATSGWRALPRPRARTSWRISSSTSSASLGKS
jgi:hypothetical protein